MARQKLTKTKKDSIYSYIDTYKKRNMLIDINFTTTIIKEKKNQNKVSSQFKKLKKH